MRLAHQSVVVSLFALGTAWAMCLALAGLSCAALAHRDGLDWAMVLLGLAGVSAGNFVFMEVVADRLFPARSRRSARSAAEIATAGLVVAATASAAVIWFARSLP